MAQKNRNEDATLEPWEDLVLSIFDAPKIKEEIEEDEEDSSWMKTESSSYGISGSVPEAIKVIIAKSMMRQKQMIFRYKFHIFIQDQNHSSRPENFKKRRQKSGEIK